MKQWYITPKTNKEHTTKISPLNNTHSLPDRRRRWRTFRHTDIHKQIQHMYAHTYKHNYLYTSIQPMHSHRQVVVHSRRRRRKFYYEKQQLNGPWGTKTDKWTNDQLNEKNPQHDKKTYAQTHVHTNVSLWGCSSSSSATVVIPTKKRNAKIKTDNTWRQQKKPITTQPPLTYTRAHITNTHTCKIQHNEKN